MQCSLLLAWPSPDKWATSGACGVHLSSCCNSRSRSCILTAQGSYLGTRWGLRQRAHVPWTPSSWAFLQEKGRSSLARSSGLPALTAIAGAVSSFQIVLLVPLPACGLCTNVPLNDSPTSRLALPASSLIFLQGTVAIYEMLCLVLL